MDKTMRNKDKIVAYVYETYDYDKFKKLEGNRRVLDRRNQYPLTGLPRMNVGR